MCGIAGVYGWVDEGIFNDMLSEIRHRGPDEQGVHVDGDVDLMMGAKRLSILDLKNGSQPIYNEKDDVVVVFNGEIYNYRKLRNQLEANGHQFSTDCDTEVLVHLWEEYGESMPKHLNGMFAFSLWDSSQKQLFIARDRLGIKPLYYVKEDTQFIWASEIQPLLATGMDRSINPGAVYDYFALQYSPGPQTLFENILKLEPGSSLLITSNGTQKRRFWQLPSHTSIEGTTNFSEKIKDLVTRAVERRLMADVPIGAFLSGGVDSSIITGVASEMYDNKLKTFSIGFPQNQFDESEDARIVADHFGTDHHQIDVDSSLLDTLPKAINRFGEPLADPAILPTMVLSEFASQEVKCVLTGEGADELFAGYQYYHMTPSHRKVLQNVPKFVFRGVQDIGQIVPAGDKYFRYFSSLRSDARSIIGWAGNFELNPEMYINIDESTELEEEIQNDVKNIDAKDPLMRMTKFDLTYSLPNKLLYKVDHSTMNASLEARVPFLDHNLVEFAYGIPSHEKTKNGYKHHLKSAFSDLLPQHTLEREKQGFNLPIAKWLKDDHEIIERYLNQGYLSGVPYVNADAVTTLKEEHKRGIQDHKLTLWKVLNFAAWYGNFIEGE